MLTTALTGLTWILVGVLLACAILAVREGFVIREALRELHVGLTTVRSGVQRLGEQLPVVEAAMRSAREDIQHVADEQVALLKANEESGKFLDHAIEELREDRKKREEVPDDAWKAGEVAMSRMSRVRQSLIDREESSFKEMLAGEKR